VPVAVTALIRNWWPMVFFCLFKAPAEGRTHIFRANEPFAQIIVIPEESSFELEPMSEDRGRRARATVAPHLFQQAEACGRHRVDLNRPIRCSTASIGICIARQRKRRGKGNTNLNGFR
jgi:hypothetical protein